MSLGVPQGQSSTRGFLPVLLDAIELALGTIDHLRRYNIGLVGGKLQLAVLEKVNGEWTAHHEDPGETEQQIKSLETYIADFREKQKPEAAADATEIDLHKELDALAACWDRAANPTSRL